LDAAANPLRSAPPYPQLVGCVTTRSAGYTCASAFRIWSVLSVLPSFTTITS
jgi:hypothetical protein